MKKFDIIGMSCASCSARIEKSVSKVKGVSKCSVNLLTNSMNVDGNFSDSDIINAVIEAGYEVGSKNNQKNKEIDIQTKKIFLRLILSLILLLILMYFSMGRMMFNMPLPAYFENNPLANGLTQMILSLSILIINNKFFVSGFRSIMKKSPNMDTLVSIGSGASFIYSTYSLFQMSNEYINSNIDLAKSFLHELYFESAAMILVLITLGKLLEEYSKGKTTNALNNLMDLKPKTAIILSDGVEKEIPANELKIDDIFIVKPGGNIPADGVVIEGYSAVDESTLTGESIPVEKEVGNEIKASTINQSGYLKCKVTKIGEDTTISQIIKMVGDAAASKAPIAKTADKVSGIFVPVVIIIAVITTIVWLLMDYSLSFALSRGISVLVISCPCSLGLATPVAIMVGNGVGAKNGILFKNAASLESAGKIKTIALDKTGTITTGEPYVTDILTYNINQKDFLETIYSLEKNGEHPLARAICEKAKSEGISTFNVTDFKAHPGNGVSAQISDKIIYGGSLKFINSIVSVSEDIKKTASDFAKEGKTPLLFVSDNELIGIVSIADKVKDDSKKAITIMKKIGLRVVMLTGDNKETGLAVKEQTGIDEVISDVLPQDKAKYIMDFKKRAKTAMVGDGINDAPALTSADVGIAIGAGTDIAIESADIVLMKNSLLDAVNAIKLSRKTLKNIRENLFWAFIYNIIGIPIAAGVLIPAYNIKLEPMFAAAAMSLSSFCVVINALRLNTFKCYEKEIKQMETMIKIDGMMCPHCEARVKSALELLDGVTEVIPDHTKKNAVIKHTKEVSLETIKKVIYEQGYTVIE